MTAEDEIVAALRNAATTKTPVELAILFGQLSGGEGELSYSALIGSFSVAFPKIPLRVLLSLGKWKRVGGVRWSDEDVNRALGEWFPYRHESI